MEIKLLTTVQGLEVYEEEVAQCLGICLASARKFDGCESVVLNKMQSLRDHLSKGEAFPLIALDGSSVLGFLWGYINPNYTGHSFHIGYIAVMENARGKGVGTELINAAKEIACDHFCDSVELVVDQGNDAACTLYRKCGFSTERLFMTCPLS